MKGIKSIIVKGTMAGFGIVQFDNADQKWMHNRCKGVVLANHDNVSFAKACFAEQLSKEGGTIITKSVKISPDGLRHAIHIEEHPYHTPNISFSTPMKTFFQANLGTLERGYMIATDSTSERKKSCYAITAAREVSGALPTLEFFSRSGEKEVNKGKDVEEDKGTTIHVKDSIGTSKYEFTAFIDPSELGFISLSDLQDRRAIQDENEALFLAELSQNLGSPVQGSRYYVQKGSAYRIPEKGILLTGAQTKLMVLDLLRKMCRVDIRKSQGGFAKVTDLSVKFIVDPEKDTEQDPTGWISVKKGGITSMDGVDEAISSFTERYLEVDVDAALKALEAQAEGKALVKDAKKAKKAAEKEAKEKAKAAKAAKVEG